jgi:serine/threonine-protein kinase
VQGDLPLPDRQPIDPRTGQPPGPPPLPQELQPALRGDGRVGVGVAEPALVSDVHRGVTPATSREVPPAPAHDQPVVDGSGGTLFYNEEFLEPPRRRRRGWIAAAVVLVVALLAGGFVTFLLLKEDSYTVPDLTGISEGVARNQVAENGWDVVVQTERDDDQAQGNIIRTDPAAGEKLKENNTIVFVVSAGPTLSTLPDVTGLPVADATATLSASRLDLTVADSVFDEVVPKDAIISWTVPAQPGLTAGTEVMQRTVVAVVVSKGPQPRVVPLLIGLDHE